MKILVLGGDGYLGWPTALHLSEAGHEVAVADNFVRRHYDDVAGQLSLEGLEPQELPPGRHYVLVLVGDVHRGVLGALRYAQAISPNARAIYVETDAESRRRLEQRAPSRARR